MRRLVATFVLAVAPPLACHSGGQGAATGASDDGGADAGDGAAGYGYPPGAPHVSWFREVPSDISGVNATHQPDLALPFSGGIGVAVGDIDGNGRPDIIAPTGLGPTYVYKNQGGFRFSDVTAASGVDGRGVANGASLCDVDGDGDLDLFLSTDEQRPDTNVFFFRNRGDGTFADETTAAGFATKASVASVVCTDLDGDGLLDVYVAAYAFIGAKGFPGRQDAFYRNRGDGTFVDVAARLGFDAQGLTWTVAASDYDGDGDLDLYVANDTFTEDDGTRPLPSPPDIPGTSAPPPGDALFRNDGPGPDGYPVFTNVTATSGAPVAEPRSTMGIVAADMTGDGIPDYYLSNYGRKALLAGGAGATFADRTADFGLEATQRYAGPDGNCGQGSAVEPCLLVGWGSALEDFDLDGRPDLVLVDGTLHGEQQPQAVWRGGAAGAAPAMAFAPVQTDLPWMVARALVPSDLDGDGDPDLVVTTWRGATRIFEDVASQPGAAGAGWLGVALEAATSAPEGRGAVVTVNGVSKTVGAGGVIDSSAPALARFGLAGANTATVDVQWPSGFRSHVGPVMADQIVTFTEPPLLAVSARTAPADGVSTVTVTAKPAKSDGTPLGPGATVTIDASAGTWQGAVLDVGDGSYTRVLVAPSAPALAVLRVTINGAPLRAYPRVEFR